jgi:hypothetical protein
VLPERVDDAAEPPAVFVAGRRVTVAPAARAALITVSGSPVTSRVRLVPAPIATALKRPLSGSAFATQKYASPVASCATMSSPSPAWWTTVAPKAAW